MENIKNLNLRAFVLLNYILSSMDDDFYFEYYIDTHSDATISSLSSNSSSSIMPIVTRGSNRRKVVNDKNEMETVATNPKKRAKLPSSTAQTIVSDTAGSDDNEDSQLQEEGLGSNVHYSSSSLSSSVESSDDSSETEEEDSNN